MGKLCAMPGGSTYGGDISAQCSNGTSKPLQKSYKILFVMRASRRGEKKNGSRNVRLGFVEMSY